MTAYEPHSTSGPFATRAMGEPYTPTTSQVRGYYTAWVAEFDPDDGAAGEFDRWLAAHDKEVLDAAVSRVIEVAEHGFTCDAMADPNEECDCIVSEILAAIRGEGVE